MTNWFHIPTEKLPKEGSAISIEIEKKTICVIQKSAVFYAIDDECPHAGASLSRGLCKDHWVVCPMHDIRFDIRNGKGQTEKFSIKSYPVEKLENGIKIMWTHE